MLIDEYEFILNNKDLFYRMHSYYILLTFCVVFAAHGAQIPGRDEKATNNVPGKVNIADWGGGL